MTEILITTHINAPAKAVFNLSLNIDFHQESASQTQETAIAGVTSGIIGLKETVTWRGKHLGCWLTHTSIISEHTPYSHFVDEMTKGNFKSFVHRHSFDESDNTTIMTDHLTYEVPFGIFGQLFNHLLLKRHLVNFLKKRNFKLKAYLE